MRHLNAAPLRKGKKSISSWKLVGGNRIPRFSESKQNAAAAAADQCRRRKIFFLNKNFNAVNRRVHTICSRKILRCCCCLFFQSLYLLWTCIYKNRVRERSQRHDRSLNKAGISWKATQKKTECEGELGGKKKTTFSSTFSLAVKYNE